mmetsp:Transcript_14756/g.13355  ORF Transcript_14756/g.13355 Transcript_14756/m.13355 type:complete len:233 (+) Transcript_14756:59-757(+)
MSFSLNLNNFNINRIQIYNVIFKKSENGTGIDYNKIKYEPVKYLVITIGLIACFSNDFYFYVLNFIGGIMLIMDLIIYSNINFSLITPTGKFKVCLEWCYEKIQFISNVNTFILSFALLLLGYVIVNLFIAIIWIVYVISCVFKQFCGFTPSVNDKNCIESTHAKLSKSDHDDAVTQETVIDDREPRVAQFDSDLISSEILIDIETGPKSFKSNTVIEFPETNGETVYVFEE